jgi:hypothetical protein
MNEDHDQRLIAETLKFYRETVGWLEQHHAEYARKAELDLVGNDRPSAIWKLAGESIGAARALVDLLDAGYTTQTFPMMRSIHESNRLLSAVADLEEEEIAERWLADKEVKQSEAREAEQRQADRIAEQMKAAGVEPPPEVQQLTRTVYRGLSKAAHHQRSVVDEAIDFEAGAMIYGPDPRTARRLEFVIFAGTLIQEVLLKVGDALCVLWGPGFYDRHLRPMLQRFREMLDVLEVIDAARRVGL